MRSRTLELRTMANSTCCEHVRPCGPEDADVECCLCTRAACSKATLGQAVEHGWAWRWVASEEHREEVAYVLAHGHLVPDPWGDPGCPPGCKAPAEATEKPTYLTEQT